MMVIAKIRLIPPGFPFHGDGLDGVGQQKMWHHQRAVFCQSRPASFPEGRIAKWIVIQINSSGGNSFSGRGYADINSFGVTGGTISLNTWHHVVNVIDRSGPTAKSFIYIDGVNVSGAGLDMPTLVGNLDMAGAPIQIGATWADYRGVIDEFVIYNRALTSVEISARHQLAP